LKHFFNVLFFIIALVFFTSNCARKGRPSGGLKDSIAPLMVTAIPPYKSIHFSAKKIKISFDEYITLKNVTQQLVISPPLKFSPIITPQGAPSKDITIRLKDTLKENTTYTLNFGNSIQDNNEGNQLKSFKYIFSTGTYIDSLKTKGTIKDAYVNTFDKNCTVLLYKIDSTYNDSIIYKKKPNYVTSTLDSTLFTITNIKKGRYLLIALKDISANYLFNAKEDKIGFYNRFIEIPNDSILKEPIALFKEIGEFRFVRPKQRNKGKIQFGFEGDRAGVHIQLLSSVSGNFQSIVQFEPEKDTLNYWHTAIKNDSLVFKVSNKTYIDTVTVFLRNKIIDSLKINSNISRTLGLRDTLTLTGNNPITKIDISKISFIDKDSIKVPFVNLEDKKTNQIKFLFDKKYNEKYTLQVFPEAFIDIFETKNDTLIYSFNTKEPEDYVSIKLKINKKATTQVIIELLKEQNKKRIERVVVTDNATVRFKLLPPSTYIIRAITDTNKNGKWDTGNYLQKRAPEKVIYHPTIFNIRSNWDLPTESIRIHE
jgi:uncharacterized protein (DUF2141 family)